MRTSTALVAAAVALQAAPAFAFSTVSHEPHTALTGDQIANLIGNIKVLDARSLAGVIAGDVAKVGEKVVGDSLGDAAKKGVLGGIGSLVGGTVLGKIFGNDDKSKREFLEYLEARSDQDLAARASIASVGAKIVGDSLGDAAKKGILGGIGSLIGGTVLGKLFDRDDNLEREFLEYIQAGSHEELAARAAAGGVAKAGAKIVGDSLGDAAKKGLIGGLGGVLGTGIISKIFGSSSSSSTTPAQRREILEYIQARSHEELSARAAAGGVVKAGAKIVGDSLGDAAKKGLIGGLGGVLGTGIISKIFGSNNSSAKRELADYMVARASEEIDARGLGDAAKKGILGGIGSLVGGGLLSKIFGDDDNSKREFLEILEARANQEVAATQLKRELLNSFLETRSLNDLD